MSTNELAPRRNPPRRARCVMDVNQHYSSEDDDSDYKPTAEGEDDHSTDISDEEDGEIPQCKDHEGESDDGNDEDDL
jgi:hypothetical protein